jgi:Flp pilus assembly protein TadB
MTSPSRGKVSAVLLLALILGAVVVLVVLEVVVVLIVAELVAEVVVVVVMTTPTSVWRASRARRASGAPTGLTTPRPCIAALAAA